MTQSEIKYFLQMWWFDVKLFPGKIKRRVWNGGILLWWYRLWIRKDQFHKSLDLDILAMVGISKQKQGKYLEDLQRRRNIACRRNIDQRR